MKNISLSMLLFCVFIFTSVSCKSVQIKDGPEPQNVSKVQDVNAEKPKPVGFKAASKSAYSAVKAAPAKVAAMSTKIAEKVRVETEGVKEYWPLLLILFVVIMVGYVMYDSIESKPAKRRKKTIKVSRSIIK